MALSVPESGRELDPLRIVQAIASIENLSAGTTYSVKRLSEALAEAGHNVDLLATGAASVRREGNLLTKTCAIALARAPVVGRLRFSPEYRAELEATAPGVVIHSNGLWLMPNIYPSWAARRHGTPLVVSPHGMLAHAALAFSPLRKKAFDVLLQRRALEAVSCFHATSPGEHDEIRAYGLKAPIAVLPNGIDMPTPQLPQIRPTTAERVVLSLGRLHPIKGLDRLLRAWAMLEPHSPDWRLRLVGPSEGDHRAELEALAAALGLVRVSFSGGVFGATKDIAYRSADIFVLPSLSENFGMVVAEALAHGCPVISTRGTPWSGLVEHGCGWWIDHGVEPLAAALGEAMAMPRSALEAMGDKGRAWMARDYSWRRIAADMATVYRWKLGGGDRPAFVRID